MKTIHIITTDKERELVKRIFRKAVEDSKREDGNLYNYFEGDAIYREDEDTDLICTNDLAVVYDPHGELGFTAYDFNTLEAYVSPTGSAYDLPSSACPF